MISPCIRSTDPAGGTSAVEGFSELPAERELEVACEPDRRAQRAASDAETTRRVGTMVGAFVADMFSMLEHFQAQTRDSQASAQEHDASQRSTDARVAHERRVGDLENAVTTRARAAESRGISEILGYVGAAISLAIGTVGAIFTGGASLVAAIAVAVAIIGPLVCQGLAQAGVVDREVASAVGLGIAAVATAVSLGSSAASLASAASSAALVVVDVATKAAIETATNIATIVGGLADVTTGSFQVNTAVLGQDAAEHEVDATAAGHRRDQAAELRDQAIETLGQLMRSFARVAESMAEVREEASHAGRIALARFA